MTVIVYQNALCEQTRPSLALGDRRRRRLSTIVARHAPRDRSYFVSVHKAGTLVKPEDHTVRLRRRVHGYEGPTWSETLVGSNDVVAFTTIMLGGGSDTGKQIGSALAMIALMVVATATAGPAGTALAGALSLGATAAGIATAAIQVGIVVAGAAALSLFNKPKSAAQDRALFGVSGGGNLPRAGDRVPAWHGHCWSTPDLSQPDYFVYDGEDQILYRRLCLGIGSIDVETIEIGTATLWTKLGGVQAPFASAPGGGNAGDIGGGALNPGSGGGCQVEIILPNQTSTLVPGSVYSSPSPGGAEVPRAADNPSYAGPFAVCPVDQETDTIQIDYSLPDGAYHQRQTSQGEDPINLGVLFEYAPCDDDDNPTGAFVTLHSDNTSTKSTKALRFTRKITVALGRYIVRARNTRTLNTETKDRITWDGLRAHFHDTIARPVTEIALKIRSGKSLGITAFGEVWVEGTGIKPTWNGSAWVNAPTRKAVYAYKDILQGVYGGNLIDSEVDHATIKNYATGLLTKDTYDGIIRGPVSVYAAACAVLGVMRAEPSRVGNTWSINRDEPKVIRKHKFTRRQIARGSSALSIELDRSNGECDVIVEYTPDGDPRRRSDVRITYGQEALTPRRVNGNGISSFEHAHAHALWLAAAANYRRDTHKFTVELQGRMVQRGDPASVDTWFISDGRAAGVLSRDGYTVRLDTDVTFVALTYATFRDRRGREWGPVAVSQGASANIIVVNSADADAAAASSGVSYASMFSADDEDMTSVVVGPLSVETFTIASIQPQGKDRIAIEALLDDDQVFIDLGEPPPPAPVIPSQGDAVEPVFAVVPWVAARAVQKATGLFMEWAVGRARGAVSYVVRLSYDNGGTWEAVSDSIVTDGSHPLRHEEGVNVKVGAYAVNRSGVPGPAVYKTFTTFKPVIDSDSANLLVDLESLEQTVLDQIQEGVDAAAAFAFIEPIVIDEILPILPVLIEIAPIVPVLIEIAPIVIQLQPIVLEQIRPIVLALRNSVSAVEAVRVEALKTGLIDPGVFQQLDSLGQLAVKLALQAERTESLTRELGAEFNNGRWELRGVKDNKNEIKAVSILVDLNKAAISLSASKTELGTAIANVAAGLQPAVTWAWNGTVEGWTATNGTLSAGAGYVDFIATGAGAYMESPALPSFDPADYKIVRFNAVRLAGSGWGVALSWAPGHPVTLPFVIPDAPGSTSEIALDLDSVNAWAGTITSLRVYVEAGNTIRFSYGQIAKNALASGLFAGLQGQITEVSLRLDADEGVIAAKASRVSVDAHGIRLNSAELTISAHTTSIGLRALSVDLGDTIDRLTIAEGNISAANSLIAFTVTQIQTPDLIDLAGRAGIAGALNGEANRASADALFARAHFQLGTKITNEGEVRAQQIEQLNVRAGASDAVAYVERLTRATSDYAEAAARLLLEARHDTALAQANASIAQEQIVRASADTVEASARQSIQANLTSEVATRTAAINTEVIARVAGDSAEATARQTVAANLASEVINRAAAVTTEATARANADSAEASARQQVATDLSTETSSRISAVTTEATARSNADSAEAEARQQVAAVANLKNRVFHQSIAPSSPGIGDLWFDNSSGNENRPKVWNGSSWVDARDVAITANTAAINTEATARANADSAEAIARQQVATDLSNETINRTAAVTTEANARSSADAAEASARQQVAAIANSKSKISHQSTAPSNPNIGDLWFDNSTAENENRPKVWNGSSWADARDAVITANTAAITTEQTARASGDAAEAAARQQVAAVANLKNRIFHQPTAPTAAGVGDLWFDNSNGNENRPKVWNGSAWADARDATATANTAAITAEQIARADADTAEAIARQQVATDLSNETINRTAAVTTEANARSSADAAEASARQQVAAVANSKSKISHQSAAPTSPNIGDLWFDNSTAENENRPKVWNGVAWSNARDAAVTFNTAAITTEQTARASGDAAEAAARQQVATNLATETTNRIAAVDSEATARSNADVAEATARQQVAAIANSKSRIFHQSTAPASPNIGDLWFDNSTALDENRPKVWNGSAWANARDAAVYYNAAAILNEQVARADADTAEATARQQVSAVANSKSKISHQSTAPSNPNIGDLWFDNSTAENENRPKVWNGVAWANARDAAVTFNTAAITTEQSARIAADSAEASARQQVATSLASETTDRIAAVNAEANARSSADSAEATSRQQVAAVANSKNRIFHQPTAPSTANVGDLWFDNSTAADENRPKVWNGSAWSNARDAAITYNGFAIANAVAAITAEQSARASGDSAEASARQQVAADLSTETTNRISAVNAETSARVNADSAEASARQSVAINRNRTFRQSSTPTADAVGDVWYRTDIDNEPWRWDGTSWVPTPDAKIAINAGAIVSVQSSVAEINGKLSGRWQVTLDVNGYVSGLFANNNSASSSFIILSDVFSVVAPGLSPKPMFTIANVNGAVAAVLHGTLFADYFVGTQQVADNAISAAVAVTNTNTVTLHTNPPVGSSTTISSIGLPVTQLNGKPYKVYASSTGRINFNNSNGLSLDVILRVGTTELANWRWFGGATNISWSLSGSLDVTGTGSQQDFTVNIIAQVTAGQVSSVTSENRTLYAQAIKR